MLIRHKNAGVAVSEQAQEDNRRSWAVAAASAGTPRILVAVAAVGVVVFVLLRRRRLFL